MVIELFCPVCGALSYPDDRGWIKCPDYKCGYEGPLSGEDGKGSEFTDPMTGETIDLAKTMATTDSKSLKHLTEVVEEDGLRELLERAITYAPVSYTHLTLPTILRV